MTAFFRYIFAVTAPSCYQDYVSTSTADEHVAEVEAREQAADLLGVRAKHVVLRLVETKPNF